MQEPGIELLERYFKGSASPAEVNEVETWLRQNHIDAAELKMLVTLPPALRFMFSLDTKQDWRRLKQRLPLQKTILFRPALFRMAAAILLIVTITSVLYLTLRNDVEVMTISNTGETVRQVHLPDSSAIYLNKGAQLSYRSDFLQARSVSMKGEVFYEVKRDPSHPFVIKAGLCTVAVLGTTFNVLGDSGTVEVTVATGKVSLQSNENEKIYLEKGDYGRYEAGNHTLSKAIQTDRNYLSWKTGVLEFRDSPLDEVAVDLEKYFGVDITLAGTKGKLPLYTSRFDHPNLSEVLEEIKLTLSVNYSINNKHVILTLK